MAERYHGKVVSEMRSHYWPMMKRTRDLATEARQLLAGELGIDLPENVVLAGADAWVGDTPHRLTGPQQIRQDLIAKQWEMKRPRSSGGQRADSVATRIEEPLDAIMKDPVAGFPWEPTNDVCVFEGLVFGTVSVQMSDWRKGPSLWPNGARSVGEIGAMNAQYAVDRDGRFRGDEDYDESTVDVDKARREHRIDLDDHMARHLPFRQRAYSIRSCAPIFGGDALSPELEGLIIETHWSQATFSKRGMRVSRTSTDKTGDQLYPLGAIGEGDSGGFGKQIKVIEAWLTDDDGQPYITYCVEGDNGEWLPAWRQGENGSAEKYLIDLAKIAKDKRGTWRGFTRLPVSWGWGLGWSTTDLDKRTLPYTKPFQQGWRNFDALMTTVIAANMFLAFPALIEKVSMAEMASQGLDQETPNVPDIAMLKITRVTGDIINIGGQGPHPSVFEAMRMALGENKAEAAGGQQEGAESGFAMTISEALKQNALTTVNDTVMRMASMNGSYVLEAAKFLGECYEPVLVYKLPDVLLEQKNPSDTGKPMTLDPALIGSNYDVKAIAVKVPGENPAKRQQDAALVKEGFYDTEWFLEQDGYSAPTEMAARVMYETVLKSEPGQQATMRMLSQYVSDKWVDQILEAIAGQQANQQGLASGFADGTTLPPEMQAAGMLQAGPQATGGMDGLGTPNPAQASLNGQIAGGMQQGPINNAVQAGGQLPPGFTGGV